MGAVLWMAQPVPLGRIAAHINFRLLTILAAWRTLVDSRPYLRNLARDIAALPDIQVCTRVQLGHRRRPGPRGIRSM